MGREETSAEHAPLRCLSSLRGSVLSGSLSVACWEKVFPLSTAARSKGGEAVRRALCASSGSGWELQLAFPSICRREQRLTLGWIRRASPIFFKMYFSLHRYLLLCLPSREKSDYSSVNSSTLFLSILFLPFPQPLRLFISHHCNISLTQSGRKKCFFFLF